MHAHPDDEASKGAATLARYAAEGHRVMVATMTGGERGDVLNSTITDPEVKKNLQEYRIAEMAESARILGIEHRWIGFVDSGLPQGDPLPPLPEGSFATLDPAEAARPLVALIRDFRPHVLITYDENGGYPHPDHIQTHRVTVEAWHAAGDARRYPEEGEPWAPLKLYYDRNITRERFQAFDEELRRRGQENPYAELLARWRINEDTGYSRVTTHVPCAEYFPQREAALRAHATQIDPGSPFFFAPLELQQHAWPVENYELAATRVAVTIPENDVFAHLPVEDDE